MSKTNQNGLYKFWILLKKELREMLSAQTIFGMIFTVVLMVVLGQFLSSTMDKAMSTPSGIAVLDLDHTEFTSLLLDTLAENGLEIEKIEAQPDTLEAPGLMAALDRKSLMILHQGFSRSILENKQPGNVELISVMSDSSALGNMDSAISSDVMEMMSEIISNMLLKQEAGLEADEITFLKEPLAVQQTTVVGENSAPVSAGVLAQFTMMQSMILPIVIFILIMFSSQMIIAAISNEKIDKTLETLLSAPVSRMAVLSAKMLGAALVALLNAVVYMLGFTQMMSSMGGDSGAAGNTTALNDAVTALGLRFSTMDYVLLGVQMFLTILIVLAASLILGAMATDLKSTQTLMMPIMLLAMIPYMLSLMTSFYSMPVVVQVFLFLIPFTHTFTASDSLLFNHMPVYWSGLAYQCVLLIVTLFSAVRLFQSDKLFTISLNFGQKMKMKNKQAK